MFGFEKLTVYHKAKVFHLDILELIESIDLDKATMSQLRRSSLSIPINIAEGQGRKTTADRRNFFVISRGYVFECVAIMDILKDRGIIDNATYHTLYNSGEEVSKMLYKLAQ